MPVMTAVKPDDPLMIAWKAYQQTEDFANTKRWALRTDALRQAGVPIDPDGEAITRARPEQRDQWVQGSLWAAFMAGWLVATERAAMLHESVRPTSDEERLNKVPGAGAMGAVIEYRDLIRKRSA